MTLVKHKPVRFGTTFPAFTNFFGDILGSDVTQFLGSDLSKNIPAVNVAESDANFRVEVAAPGLKKEDFTVNVENGVLTVSSEKKTETGETTEKFTRKEFSFSSFERRFTLPESIDDEKISATYTDGVLNIVLPKKQVKVEQSKKISIS